MLFCKCMFFQVPLLLFLLLLLLLLLLFLSNHLISKRSYTPLSDYSINISLFFLHSFTIDSVCTWYIVTHMSLKLVCVLGNDMRGVEGTGLSLPERVLVQQP